MGLFDGDDEEEGKAAAQAEALAAVEQRVDKLLRFLHVPPSSVDDRPELSEGVLYWLARGSLIHAIKTHREETGSSLKEAKDAVDGVAAVNPLVRIGRKLDAALEHLGVSRAEAGDADAADEEADPLAGETVDGLLRQDRLIEAIKLYRQETGAGLGDAKNAVDERREALRESAGTA